MIPLRIIIHHSLTKDSGTVSWGAIRKYHMSYRIDGTSVFESEFVRRKEENDGIQFEYPWEDIGYHWGQERVNDHIETLLGRMSNEEGAHVVGFNQGSIGICVVGNYDVDLLTPDHKKALRQLVKWLLTTYKIPYTMVYGHRDFNSQKSCPGENLYRFVRELKEN